MMSLCAPDDIKSARLGNTCFGCGQAGYDCATGSVDPLQAASLALAEHRSLVTPILFPNQR